MKAPSTNLQASEKLQASSSNLARDWCLMFGVWNFSGAWSLDVGAFVSLELGAWNLELI
jgi:hypothetical protein